MRLALICDDLICHRAVPIVHRKHRQFNRVDRRRHRARRSSPFPHPPSPFPLSLFSLSPSPPPSPFSPHSSDSHARPSSHHQRPLQSGFERSTSGMRQFPDSLQRSFAAFQPPAAVSRRSSPGSLWHVRCARPPPTGYQQGRPVITSSTSSHLPRGLPADPPAHAEGGSYERTDEQDHPDGRPGGRLERPSPG